MDRFAAALHDYDRTTARAASAAALNRTAKGVELLAKRNIKRMMITRNKWTLGSIKSTRTPPSRPVARQFVLVGSAAPYMAAQESGGTLGRSKVGRRLTTSEGSREGPQTKPRKKMARGKMDPRRILLGGRRANRKRGASRSPGSKAKRIVESARAARRKFIYLDLGSDNKGIYLVQKRKIKMVHRIMTRPMHIKPRKWFEPAVEQGRRIAPGVFFKGLQKSTALKR
jgi:hypothetical protein